MGTELAAERLTRRLGAAADPGDSDSGADEAANPDTRLSRWLPAASPDDGPGWIAAIRADPGRAGLFALGVVAVVAVLVTVFAIMRDRPPPITSSKLPPVQMVSSAKPTPSGSPAPEQPVVVSVVGLVHKPGLVTLQPGARIADAVGAAGGALDGADLLGLNMAQRLTDGTQIVVGIAPAPGQPTRLGSSVAPSTGGSASSSSPSAKPTASSTGPIDLNTATVEQLDALPGVGPVTAAAIVAWRDANGKFTNVDQLGDVDGIGPARLDKLRSLVRV
ncbi:MAG: competence protein ComEA [Mycobacterium sp.]|jgi:competence protein ComEA|nr:competence protein ComEA [Mycobacterium sp.]